MKRRNFSINSILLSIACNPAKNTAHFPIGRLLRMALFLLFPPLLYADNATSSTAGSGFSAILISVLLVITTGVICILLFLNRKLRHQIIEKTVSEKIFKQREEELVAQYKGIPVPTYSWRKQGEDFVLMNYNNAAEIFNNDILKGSLGEKLSEYHRTTPEIISGVHDSYMNQSSVQRTLKHRVHTAEEEKYIQATCVFIPPEMVMVHAEDITERKRAEEKLRFQAMLMDQIRDCIIATDLEGRIIYANDSAVQVLRMEGKDIIGQKVHLLSEPLEKGISQKEILYKTIANGRWRGRVIRTSGEEKERILDERTWLIYDEKGKPTGIVGIAMDITDRVETEKALRAAKEAAEAATRAKSEFLANMSHEIRTPLNTIVGMTELLLDSELTPGQKEQLDAVYVSSDLLLTLINDILDFSKIEAGKLELVHVDFDIERTIKNIIEMVAVKTVKKGLTLNYLIDTDVPRNLRGDPGRLSQILINLLSNAIKFTDNGGVDVRVKLETENAHSTILRFSVSDTGIGIPENKKDKLFVTFSQIDTSMSRKHGGTGLGLAISKQLVEMMGGTIGLNPRENQGATFWFTAAFEKTSETPRYQRFSADKPSIDKKRTSNSEIESTSTDVHILLVEDNAPNRELAVQMLNKLDFHSVISVDNGISAIDVLKQHSFDLIVMDIHMPGMDGFELTRIIRKPPPEGLGLETPIIALTANAVKGDYEQCINAGMNDYVTKPVRLQELRKILNKHLFHIQSPPSDNTGASATDSTAATKRIFDRERALQKLGINERIFSTYIGMCMENIPELLTKIQFSLKENDLNTVAIHAHTIKGMSATMCADLLNEVAIDLERMARNDDFPNTSQKYPQLVEKFEQLKQFLDYSDNS